MALVGGLAAATLVNASLVITVVVSLVIGVVGAAAVLRPPAAGPELTGHRTATVPRAQPRPAESARAESGGAESGRAESGRGEPTRAAPVPESYPPDPVAPVAAGGLNRGAAPAVNETVVQMLPLGTDGQADAPWWDPAHPAPAPSAGAKRAPAPDLSTYLASTFIAQCPRCGAFRLDIRRARSGWDFRCEACDNTWTWQPGTPWPQVRVMPP
jgi:hypothetical protein